MSTRNSLSQLFPSIFNDLKKQRKPSLQKGEFISLFEDTEDMINDLREQFNLFIESTKKSDRLLMIDDLITVDNVINRAEFLVSTVIRDLQDTEDDISRRKVHFRKQIELLRQATACGYFAVGALCESGNSPEKKILKKLQKSGLLGKTELDEIAKSDICSLEQRRKRIHKSTETHRTSDTCENTDSGKYRSKRNRVNKKLSNRQNKSSFREYFSTLFHRIVSVFVN